MDKQPPQNTSDPSSNNPQLPLASILAPIVQSMSVPSANPDNLSASQQSSQDILQFHIIQQIMKNEIDFLNQLLQNPLINMQNQDQETKELLNTYFLQRANFLPSIQSLTSQQQGSISKSHQQQYKGPSSKYPSNSHNQKSCTIQQNKQMHDMISELQLNLQNKSKLETDLTGMSCQRIIWELSRQENHSSNIAKTAMETSSNVQNMQNQTQPTAVAQSVAGPQTLLVPELKMSQLIENNDKQSNQNSNKIESPLNNVGDGETRTNQVERPSNIINQDASTAFLKDGTAQLNGPAHRPEPLENADKYDIQKSSFTLKAPQVTQSASNVYTYQQNTQNPNLKYESSTAPVINSGSQAQYPIGQAEAILSQIEQLSNGQGGAQNGGTIALLNQLFQQLVKSSSTPSQMFTGKQGLQQIQVTPKINQIDSNQVPTQNQGQKIKGHQNQLKYSNYNSNGLVQDQQDSSKNVDDQTSILEHAQDTMGQSNGAKAPAPHAKNTSQAQAQAKIFQFLQEIKCSQNRISLQNDPAVNPDKTQQLSNVCQDHNGNQDNRQNRQTNESNVPVQFPSHPNSNSEEISSLIYNRQKNGSQVSRRESHNITTNGNNSDENGVIKPIGSHDHKINGFQKTQPKKLNGSENITVNNQTLAANGQNIFNTSYFTQSLQQLQNLKDQMVKLQTAQSNISTSAGLTDSNLTTIMSSTNPQNQSQQIQSSQNLQNTTIQSVKQLLQMLGGDVPSLGGGAGKQSNQNGPNEGGQNQQVEEQVQNSHLNQQSIEALLQSAVSQSQMKNVQSLIAQSKDNWQKAPLNLASILSGSQNNHLGKLNLNGRGHSGQANRNLYDMLANESLSQTNPLIQQLGNHLKNTPGCQFNQGDIQGGHGHLNNSLTGQLDLLARGHSGQIGGANVNQQLDISQLSQLNQIAQMSNLGQASIRQHQVFGQLGEIGDNTIGLNLNSELDIYRDMISDGDDDFDHHFNGKKSFQGSSDDIHHEGLAGFMLDNDSKRIKKGFGMIGSLFKRNEKVQDKGDYLLIHRMNPNTKRMNQILQCKRCPLRFPKLCNLRDHLRIHKDDMPFKCSLCGKPFTQAGNRDRHERKRVCQKRNNSINNNIELNSGYQTSTVIKNQGQGTNPQRKHELLCGNTEQVLFQQAGNSVDDNRPNSMGSDNEPAQIMDENQSQIDRSKIINNDNNALISMQLNQQMQDMTSKHNVSAPPAMNKSQNQGNLIN